jgi:hypothetical protein
MRFAFYMPSTSSRVLLAFFLVFAAAASRAHAGWLDWLKPADTTAAPPAAVAPAASNPAPAAPAAPAVPALTALDIGSGLKDALTNGAAIAIASLGKQDGFLKNPDVKIPLPSTLTEIDKALRLVGKEQYADDFVVTMNRAAEAAVGDVGPIFVEAITNMTVADAEQILKGPDDAATQYLRKVGEAQIKQRMLPIVTQATDTAGATAAYKNLMDNSKYLGTFMHQPSFDLDQYVTDKATDGLFKMIADQEKQIRQNPLARTDDLLKKVFGATAP